jgi:hypothetical protein
VLPAKFAQVRNFNLRLIFVFHVIGFGFHQHGAVHSLMPTNPFSEVSAVVAVMTKHPKSWGVVIVPKVPINVPATSRKLHTVGATASVDVVDS